MDTKTYFQCGRKHFQYSGPNSKPLVMGILNITPDSFFDGNRYIQRDAALRRADEMLDAGVDIIDVGAESTRPGFEPDRPYAAHAVDLEEELTRLIPVLERLKGCDAAISVDTYKPEVMRTVLGLGVDMINNQLGFRTKESVAAVKDSTCGICVMHMKGSPKNMQQDPQYSDVYNDVKNFLTQGVHALTQAGVEQSRICIDPGFGFGKTLTHNLTLIKNIRHLGSALNLPVLAGISRKSMLCMITGRLVEDRLAASLAGALAAVAQGAFIVRVHDVIETIDALNVWQVIQG